MNDKLIEFLLYEKLELSQTEMECLLLEFYLII